MKTTQDRTEIERLKLEAAYINEALRADELDEDGYPKYPELLDDDNQ